MYKLLLILKYLRRKLAPMFAVVAVMLCTAMVIIVISVMGGFLVMMENAVQTLTGDVTVHSGLAGFPHYEELLADLRARPEVRAATPVVQSYGLVKIGGIVRTVEAMGIEPAEFHRVMLHRDSRTGEEVGYRDTLYWTTGHLLGSFAARPPDANTPPPELSAYLDWQAERYRDVDLRELGMTMKPPLIWGYEADAVGFVPGIEVSPFNDRNDEGEYDITQSMLGDTATLTVLPITQQGGVLGTEVRELVIVNEFKSGLFEVDARRVYMPFDLLQRMLKMDAGTRVDRETGEVIGTTAARASEILVRAQPGQPLPVIRAAVADVVEDFRGRYTDMPRLDVVTWRDQHRTLLGAVQKEKLMVTFLFAFISLVAVVMIAVIFYMIVLEKTRDIGTLRAIGASRTGIASIFVGYGLAIGVLGAGLGFTLAALIVWNLNEIQEFLAWSIGFQMWDPRIYYFDRIPNRLDPVEVTVILIVAVVSSVIGSIIPAILASSLNPVEALRYE